MATRHAKKANGSEQTQQRHRWHMTETPEHGHNELSQVSVKETQSTRPNVMKPPGLLPSGRGNPTIGLICYIHKFRQSVPVSPVVVDESLQVGVQAQHMPEPRTHPSSSRTSKQDMLLISHHVHAHSLLIILVRSMPLLHTTSPTDGEPEEPSAM